MAPRRGGRGNYQQIQYEEKLLDPISSSQESKPVYRKYQLLVCVLLDLALEFVFYGFYISFNLRKSLRKEYTIDKSLDDVNLLSWIRCSVLLMILCKPNLQKLGFWVSVFSLFFILSKVIVWGDWGQGFGSACIVSQLFIILSEMMITKYYKNKASDRDVEDGSGDGAGAESTNSSWNLLKVLGPYFWPRGICNRIRVASTWICVGLSKGANIMAPLYIGNAVNELRNGRVDYFSIIMYAALSFANVLFNQLQKLIYLRVKQTAYQEISRNTFEHLHSLSLEWHLKKKMGHVLRSMDRGVNSANTVVSYLFLYLVPSMVECLIVFVIFYTRYEEPALAVIAFLGVSGYALSTITITLWRKKFRKQTNRHDNALHDKATDSLTNFETVKYFTNEKYEMDDYSDSVRQYIKYDVNTQASLALLNTIQQMFIDVTLGAVLCLSAYRVTEGDMSVGDFVAINVYIVQLFAPLSFLGSIYNAIIQAFVDMTNLSQLLSLEPDVKDHPNAKVFEPNPKGCEIEFKNVRFHYPSLPDTTGLQGISFSVKRGTTTAIVGHTGAGKSTIGRLLFRFYNLKSGQILIDGQDISMVKQASLRGAIGVVPQDTVMFNKSVYHNIHYGNLETSKEEVVNACRAAQILPFIERLPEKWETKVGERGLKLSGGEKQRVAIARCLLKDPPIVLLDEATSSLDTVTEQNVQKAILKLGRNRTCLVIAHRLSTIAHAEQIIVLDKGNIVEKGTHEELMELKGGYYELWSAQSRKVSVNETFFEDEKADYDEKKIA